jgi:hypothetical protein
MANTEDKVKAMKRKRQPQNRSRIVIEGIDEPKREGQYSDRIKIDPFATTYQWPVARKPITRT